MSTSYYRYVNGPCPKCGELGLGMQTLSLVRAVRQESIDGSKWSYPDTAWQCTNCGEMVPFEEGVDPFKGYVSMSRR